MDLTDVKQLLEAAEAQQLNVTQLKALKQDLVRHLQDYIDAVSYDPDRADHRRPVGSPLDSLVQRLAADYLRLLRRGGVVSVRPGPHGRAELKMRLEDGPGLSYEQIGERYGASRQRVQQVFEQLCPLDYQALRRRSPGTAEEAVG